MLRGGSRYPNMMNPRTKTDVMVEPIQIGDIRPLFPLIQAVEPGLQLPQWLGYARRMAKGRRSRAREGIVVARRRGLMMPCGAVCYRLDRDLRHGTLLTAEHFIAMDLLYPQQVRAALSRALEVMAVELGCVIIRSIVSEGDIEVVEELRLAGHSEEGRTLTKYCRP